MSYWVIFDQAMYLGFIGNYKMHVIRRIQMKALIILSTVCLLAMSIIQIMNLVNVFHGTMLQQTHGHRIQKNYRQFNARSENIKRNITGLARQRLYGQGKARHNQHEPSTYKVDEETLHLPDFVVKCKSGDYMNYMFVGGLVPCLHCLCLFAYSGIQHTLCCVFLRIVCPVLPVSLDCSFWLPLRYSLTFIDLWIRL